MAKEAEIELRIEDFDVISQRTPLLADMKPWGRFTAVDLYNAGGMALLAKRLLDAGLLLHSGFNRRVDLDEAALHRAVASQQRHSPRVIQVHGSESAPRFHVGQQRRPLTDDVEILDAQFDLCLFRHRQQMEDGVGRTPVAATAAIAFSNALRVRICRGVTPLRSRSITSVPER